MLFSLSSLRSAALGLVSFPLTLLACAPLGADGANEANEARATTDDLTVGGVCAPLDYGHTTLPLDYHRFFASDEEAATYVQSIERAGAFGGNRHFKEVSTDARLLRITQDVFDGFQRVFAREMVGLTAAPRVVILESTDINAFALGPTALPGEAAQSPYLFFVHTALLDRHPTDNELRGLFGHELGHLFLRTFLPEIQERLRATYLIENGEAGIFGAAQANDPAAAAHVDQLFKAQQRVSGLYELGLPRNVSPWMAEPMYSRYLTSLLDQSPPSAACSAARQEMAELTSAQQAVIPGLGEGNFVPRTLSTDEKARFDDLTRSIGDHLRACVPPGGLNSASLMILIAVENRLPETSLEPNDPGHGKLVDLMLEEELRVDAEGPDAPLVDRILRVESAIRKKVGALRSDPAFPIDRLRVFEGEEDADDASVRVLGAIGADPMGNGQFLLDIIPADAKAKCLADVDAGRPIPYGGLMDPHPNTCWRYYHSAEFAKSLATCSPNPGPGRRLSGPAPPSSAPGRAASAVNARSYGR